MQAVQAKCKTIINFFFCVNVLVEYVCTFAAIRFFLLLNDIIFSPSFSCGYSRLFSVYLVFFVKEYTFWPFFLSKSGLCFVGFLSLLSLVWLQVCSVWPEICLLYFKCSLGFRFVSSIVSLVSRQCINSFYISFHCVLLTPVEDEYLMSGPISSYF